MTFATSLPWWGWLALAAGIAGLSWLAYRRARASLSRPRHALLVGLRALTLLALVLVLLRPVRVEPRTDAGGLVPILVDASGSMSLTDGGTRSRFDAALELARARVAPSLSGRFVPQIFTFGERLSPLPDGEAPRPEAHASRLGDALQELRDRLAGRRVPGIVVISDGAVSAPASLATVAPVHAIVVGAERIGRDREVFGATIGDARLQSSLVDLSVLVVAHGERPEAFDVTLLQNGQPVDVRRVRPSPDAAPQRVVFRVAPARESATLYTIEAAETEGEWTTANNRLSVLASPAGVPRRILLVEGAPGHEHSFLKRSLEDDPGLALDAIVRKGENERGDATYYVQAAADRAPALISGFPATREALYAYDLVLLANVDASSLTPDAMAQLADFVSERGGGLVVLGARSFETGGLAGTRLDALMPVDLGDRAGGLVRTARGPREPFRVALTDAGAEHPVMRLGSTPAESRRAWETAPALAATAALGPPRAGASLLAATASPGGVPRALVAVQRYGRGRVLLFGGEASWRWKMMLDSGDATYDTFWRQAVRWTAGEARGPVSVNVPPPDGRRVSVSVEVRDAAFAAVPDAAVRIRVADPAGRVVEVPAERQASGSVSATFEAVESGVHKVTVDARRGSVVLGSAEAWTLVGGVNQEFVDPRRDLGPLRRFAEASGGRVVSAEEADDVAAWLASAVAPSAEMVQREVWHSPWVWAALVGLLSAEWTLRRRWGLR